MRKYSNEILAEFISEELAKIDQKMAQRAEAYVNIARKLLDEIKQSEIKPSVGRLQETISHYAEMVKSSSSDALKMAEKRNNMLGVKAILIYLSSLIIVCGSFIGYLMYQNKLLNENERLTEGYKALYDTAIKYENFIYSSKKVQAQYKKWLNTR